MDRKYRNGRTEDRSFGIIMDKVAPFREEQSPRDVSVFRDEIFRAQNYYAETRVRYDKCNNKIQYRY